MAAFSARREAATDGLRAARGLASPPPPSDGAAEAASEDGTSLDGERFYTAHLLWSERVRTLSGDTPAASPPPGHTRPNGRRL